MSQPEDSLECPEILIKMWHYAKYSEVAHSFTEQDFVDAWEQISEILKEAIKYLPNMSDESDRADAVNDFLGALLQGKCPDNIKSESILKLECRKYLARKRNPQQYELNLILCAALRSLETDGKIQRDKASEGKHICNLTLFALTDVSCTESVRQIAHYEQNKNNVSCYRTKIRANDPEHTRILAPSDAQNLILELLNAFGGWTKKDDLLKTMQNHIPKQLCIVQNVDDEDQGIDIENQEGERFSYYEFEFKAAMTKSYETAGRIWERVCKISDKVFCLYFLPKIYNIQVTQSSLGATSTVSDQNQKIERIYADELKEYMVDRDKLEIREQKMMDCISDQILRKLNGKCTEKGMNPHLLPID